MYRVFIIIAVLFISSFAKELKPAFIMESKGLVNDFVINIWNKKVDLSGLIYGEHHKNLK